MVKRPKRRWDNTKLGKAVFLSTNDKIRPFVPDTRKATRAAVASMLEQYGTIYVKPTIGTGGRGIFRVWIQQTASEPSRLLDTDEQQAQGQEEQAPAQTVYCYQRGLTARTFSTFDDLYTSMKEKMGPKYHVVQKGIDLLHYGERPFDVRVMVQKNVRGAWVVTGIIGRVAHPRKVVTNYHNGGTPLPMQLLLKPHIDPAEPQEAYIRSLCRLGQQIARHMETGFTWVRAIGIDFGIDTDLRPWVLEVNTLPDMNIFRKHPDPSVYRRMVRLSGLARRAGH
ncbi:YheC/YheD family protein [Paenibacillus chartarius]|uniref:YheC/YheD family protein n=1 Tax=Paenibacillus chartarius TaxID=747481 RepID=A0ABV6DEW9_9BACL